MEENQLIICKFGGTSVQDAASIRSCVDILLRNPRRRMALVSATSGSTDLLSEACTSARDGKSDECLRLVTKFVARHMQLAQELEIFGEVSSQINSLGEELQTLLQGVLMLRDCSSKTRDRVLSIGERSSSILVSACWSQRVDTEVKCFDIREVMHTDQRHGSALPCLEKIRHSSKQILQPLIDDGQLILSQGFIGSSPDGSTTTLGRGGSDYSAALISEALEASALEIWTDVEGIASTDPRLCSRAISIKEISYNEAAEMATFGAKVLHPTTLWPAIRAKIPVFVGSSKSKSNQGTWICSKVDHQPLVRAIAHRPSQTLLSITTPRMLHAWGFLSKVFDCFARHELSVDLVTTSEISVAITLDPSNEINDRLLDELQQLGELKVEHDLCLLALIGNRITSQAGLAAQVFEILRDINVRMVCFGASDNNLCFLVDQEQSTRALQKLHAHFLEHKL